MSRTFGRVPTHATPRTTGARVDMFDVWVAVGFVLVAAAAVAVLPEGNTLRLVLTLPVLFFAPGYLAVQAAVGPRAQRFGRVWNGLLGVGVSPAIVGVAALLAGYLQVFRPVAIVAAVTAISLVLAAGVFWRRVRAPLPDEHATRKPVPVAGVPR